MTPRPTSRTRPVFAAAGLGAIVLATTGCSDLALPGGPSYDKSTSYDFRNLQDGNARQVLPSWVPDGASGIREEQRPTGDERLIAMDVTGATLPGQCTAVESAGKPTTAEIKRGLVEEGSTSDEATRSAGAQHTTPLLEVDWWPAGQERKTTHLCGKWWVSIADGHLYAYSPETQTVAEGVESERAGAQ